MWGKSIITLLSHGGGAAYFVVVVPVIFTFVIYANIHIHANFVNNRFTNVRFMIHILLEFTAYWLKAINFVVA